MNVLHYTHLNNEYAFKELCANKNIEAFNITIANKNFQRRKCFFIILFSEICYVPFYFVNKIYEISLHAFSLIRQNKHQLNPLKKNKIAEIAAELTFECLVPFVCVALRISGTSVSLFFPNLSLRIWKIAEGGESLFYRNLSKYWQKSTTSFVEESVYDEMIPTNAIFYLGTRHVLKCLKKEVLDESILDKEIQTEFSLLLNKLAQGSPDLFHQLFYTSTLKSKKEVKNKMPYFLSFDAQHILLKIHEEMSKNHSKNPKEEETNLIEHATSKIAIKKMERLFKYVHLNLQNALLENRMGQNPLDIENQISLLKNLFSEKLFFGRAQFRQISSFFFLPSRI